MGVLDRDDAARLRGVTKSAIKKLMQRYPEGTPGGFPSRDDTKNGGPVWDESRADELRTWTSGKPGGRPRKTSAADAPATAAQTHADGTGGATGSGNPGTAATGRLDPKHRKILERLVEVNELGPGWGNHVVAGRPVIPDSDTFPYPTLKTMADRGWVEFDTRRDQLIGSSKAFYTVAEITREGFEKLAADTVGTIHGLTPAETETLIAAAAGRIARKWTGARADAFTFGETGKWQGLLDGTPAGTAWRDVEQLISKGALLFCGTDALVTGAGHAALNELHEAQRANPAVESLVRISAPVYAWLTERARKARFQEIAVSTEDEAVFRQVLSMIGGRKSAARSSYGWTYSEVIALRRMVAHMAEAIDHAHSHTAAKEHTAAVDNLAHLDKVIAKTERQIKRTKP